MPTTPAGPGGEPLRVLALSSRYPPHHLGGYEEAHHGVDERLRAHGAAVRVLVTDHREPAADELGLPDPPDVHRELRGYRPDAGLGRSGTLGTERHNHRVLRRHLQEHRPDVVVFWAMGGTSLSLIGAVRSAGVPSVHVVHDRWPLHGPVVDRFARGLRPHGPARGAVARALGSDRPRGPEGAVLLGSASLADDLVRARAIPPGWRVLPAGVSVPQAPPEPGPWAGRLLCLGSLEPRQGVDDAVDALATLGPAFRLTVAGPGGPDASRALRERAAVAGIGARLRLSGPAEGDEVTRLLTTHDALLLPVRRPPTSGLVPLEAMAHGLPVVATAAGAQAEHLDDGDNALVVPAQDPAALADAVRRLAAEPGLRERLRAGGRRTAEGLDEERFRAGVEATVRRVAREGRRTPGRGAGGGGRGR